MLSMFLIPIRLFLSKNYINVPISDEKNKNNWSLTIKIWGNLSDKSDINVIKDSFF